MPKDPTRNIVRYKVGGGHLNEFEFHKHQGEMAEEFQPPDADSQRSNPRTQAERVAQLMAQAKKKAAKIKKRKSKASPAQSTSSKKTATQPGKRTAKLRAGKRTKQPKSPSKKGRMR